MEKTDMIFEPFKMAQFSAQWPTGSLKNMHSSNPQPFSWGELAEITQTDILEYLKQSSFAYESTQGNENLRQLICHHYHQQIAANDIVLTSGAQEGIYLAMHALLQPKDHVVALTPCFEPLVKVAEDLGAEVSQCKLKADDQWKIDWLNLEACIQPTTKLLIINFPHNPTGSHISLAELTRLIDLCQQHDCWLFSDEVFRGLEHQKEMRLPAAVDLYPKAISMGVVSKALALPGIRLGWLTSQDPHLVKQLMVIKSHLSICQSSLDAQICQALIPHSELLWRRSVDVINQNKELVNHQLLNHPRYQWHSPMASATGFIQLKDASQTDTCITLANKSSIMVLPHEVFLTDETGFRLTLGQMHSETYISEIMKF